MIPIYKFFKQRWCPWVLRQHVFIRRLRSSSKFTERIKIILASFVILGLVFFDPFYSLQVIDILLALDIDRYPAELQTTWQSVLVNVQNVLKHFEREVSGGRLVFVFTLSRVKALEYWKDLILLSCVTELQAPVCFGLAFLIIVFGDLDLLLIHFYFISTNKIYL